MTLIKTTILSLIATFFKILSGLVINKAVSIYIGPSGLAIIGQFQNFSQIALITAQGAINNGVVKYTAEYKDNHNKLQSLFSTSFKISCITAFITSVIIISFSKKISAYILGNESHQVIFILFGVSIILFVLNNLFLSILNGMKKIYLFIKINIMQSVFSLFFTTALIYFFNLTGALIALATTQSIVFIFILLLFIKEKKILVPLFKEKIDTKLLAKLMSFSVMALVSAALVPGTQFFIRSYISETQGINQAGYWQGVWYISTTYLMVITTALGTYYLPRLSELNDTTALKYEILNGYKILIPLVLILGLLIYASRDIIIYILFSNDFYDMKPLFTWQIIGDIFKISSWILAYVMIAKAMTITYILTELAFNATLILITITLVNKYGTIGATYSYAINYFLYLITMMVVLKYSIKRQ